MAASNCAWSSAYGIGDAELRLRRHQVDGGVSDEDRRVVGGDRTGVRRVGLERHGPRVERLGDLVGVPHEQVRAAAVRHAVGDAVDAVVRLHLEVLEHVRVAGDQVRVHGLDAVAVDEPEGRVTRCGDDVPAATLHELHGLVGGAERLEVDDAAGRLGERGDPVDGRIGRAVLDVAGPREDVDLALAIAHRTGEGLATRCGRSLGRQRPSPLRERWNWPCQTHRMRRASVLQRN